MKYKFIRSIKVNNQTIKEGQVVTIMPNDVRLNNADFIQWVRNSVNVKLIEIIENKEIEL